MSRVPHHKYGPRAAARKSRLLLLLPPAVQVFASVPLEKKKKQPPPPKIDEDDQLDFQLGSIGYRLPKPVGPDSGSTLQYRALYTIMDRQIPYHQLPKVLQRTVEDLECEKYKRCVLDVKYYSKRCYFCLEAGVDRENCQQCRNRRRGLEVYQKNEKKNNNKNKKNKKN